MGMEHNYPLVLDASCGSRMFWFDKSNPYVLFMDKRAEEHTLCDGRTLEIAPDVIADFRFMPYMDNTFFHVVFDPPHLIRVGKESWLCKKYGKLGENWREDIRRGFAECFRVLRPCGTLIFKWNEEQIKLSEILKLTPYKPLYGNRRSKTHWIVFMKI